MTITQLVVLNMLLIVDAYIITIILNAFVHSLQKPLVALVTACLDVYFKRQVQFMDELAKAPRGFYKQ